MGIALGMVVVRAMTTAGSSSKMMTVCRFRRSRTACSCESRIENCPIILRVFGPPNRMCRRCANDAAPRHLLCAECQAKYKPLHLRPVELHKDYLKRKARPRWT